MKLAALNFNLKSRARSWGSCTGPWTSRLWKRALSGRPKIRRRSSRCSASERSPALGTAFCMPASLPMDIDRLAHCALQRGRHDQLNGSYYCTAAAGCVELLRTRIIRDEVAPIWNERCKVGQQRRVCC